MRTNPLQDFIKRFQTGVLCAMLLLISSLMIAFSAESPVVQPREIGMNFFSFFQSVVGGVGGFFSGTLNSIAELQILREEHAKAKTRLSELEGVERNLVELIQENKLLQEQLKFSQQLEYEHVPAQVIGKDPSNLFSSLSVNKGYVDGIVKNMPVIAYQNGLYGLVGKVVSVGLSSSQIIPLLDPSSYIAGRFQNTRYEGLIQGKGDLSGKLTMIHVKKRAKEEIKFGDLVITSGLSGLYPKGVSIGRVSGIRSKDYETSIEVELEPVLDFTRLEYIYILKAVQP